MTITGAPTLAGMLRLVDRLHERTQAWKTQALLIDLRCIEHVPDPTSQALVGEHIGSRLSHLRRIASVVPEAAMTGHSERVARRTGANFRVFGQEQAAIAWLREALAC